MSAVGFELLTVSGDIVFDNLLISSSEDTAKNFARETWKIRYEVRYFPVSCWGGGGVGVAG
eukprot:1885673-Rhodomonas_salina.1